jgi:hypothetical protein
MCIDSGDDYCFFGWGIVVPVQFHAFSTGAIQTLLWNLERRTA